MKEIYKALSCQVIECYDTFPSTVKIVNIETQFSKKPFNKSFEHKESWIGARKYSCVVPINNAYDIYEQHETSIISHFKKAEKIIRDEFYKWKGENDG